MHKKFMAIITIFSFGLCAVFAPATFAEELNSGTVEDYDGSEGEAVPTSSESDIMPISETGEDTPETGFKKGEITELTPGNCVLEGDVGIPCPSECYDDNGNFQACFYDAENDTYRTILEEGTSGEAEVVCADRNEPGCSESENLETENEDLDESSHAVEPATWPMILSLGAIAVTIIIIIIFNLLGRKSRS